MLRFRTVHRRGAPTLTVRRIRGKRFPIVVHRICCDIGAEPRVLFYHLLSMLACPRFSSCVVFGLLAVAGVAGVRAQLVTASPFLPPTVPGAPTGPTLGAPLENRGSIDTPGEGLKVRIYDPNRKIGAWLRVNERDPAYDFVVKQYDASRDTATVEYNGRTLVLPLREAKVTSSGMPLPGTSIAQLPPPPMGLPPGVASTTPANQTQLEAVAATVARNRALREQAAQQINQGVQAAPQAMQPQQPRLSAPPQNQAPGAQPTGTGVVVTPSRRGA